MALDLIGDAIGLTRRIRERIGEALGLRPEQVMVTFTHAHATPETIGLTDHRVHPQWVDLVANRAADAATQAVANMAPCRLFVGEGQLAGVAVNRAARDNKDGMARLSESERKRYATLDETVRVAAFCRENGSILGTLFSFACHPVCVQTQGFISADWPGAALRRLEARHQAIFLNGACGDADPVRMRSYEALEWTGQQVAGKVEEILAKRTASERPSEGPALGARRRIEIPRRDAGCIEELEREGRQLEAAAAGEARDGPLHERLFDVREKLALARMPSTLDGEVQVLKIGPLVLVGVPGEMVACVADDIRRALPGVNAWVVGYANGYLGYAVSELSFRTDAYESAPGRWSPLAPGGGERLRDEAIALARETVSLGCGL